MNNEDKIRELFAELGNLEAPVNPELWSAISSQIGTVASVTSTGLSLVAKTIIGISAAGVIGVGTYFLTQNTVDEPTQKQEVALNEQKDSTITSINVIADTTPFKPNLSEIYTIETTITCGETRNQGGDEGGDDLPYDMGLEPKSPNDLLDNTTFITTPTPNLIGETPKTNTIIPPKKEESNQIISPAQNESVQEIPLTEDVTAAPVFEITTLPNVCGLHSNGTFTIEYKGECTDFLITIMDSKQNVVFSSNRPDFEWRLLDKSGNQVKQGKYIYIITAKDKTGKAVNKYSPLTIIE